MFINASEFNYIFEIVTYGEKEMEEIKEKFRMIPGPHPFFISSSGFPPAVLHMNPSCRVIFIKHKDKLPNKSPGLRNYLQELLISVGIDKKVHLLNS